jgi:guanylate kinase
MGGRGRPAQGLGIPGAPSGPARSRLAESAGIRRSPTRGPGPGIIAPHLRVAGAIPGGRRAAGAPQQLSARGCQRRWTAGETGGLRLPGGHLFLLIGPSGSGKTTLIAELCRRLPELGFVPTTTTRAARPGERDGREYFFVSNATFDEMLERGDFLEWKRIHGNRYGTSRSRVAEVLEAGRLGIMSVDILGGVEIRGAFPDRSTAIFVRPSSPAELQRRLEARGDTPGEDAAIRLQRAERELAMAGHCDYTVINDDGRLADAVEAILRIIRERAAQGGAPSPRAGWAFTR